jgi:aldehyde dehydrogenase (NAD+)
VKPSSKAMNASNTLAKLFKKYFDEGVITCVQGGDSKINDDLLNQHWDLIFYTGNPDVGKIVMLAAAKHLTPVVLELGGKSPVIVDKDARLDLAVRRIVCVTRLCFCS